jgi:soluble lytic murein transglycosylase-like protein
VGAFQSEVTKRERTEKNLNWMAKEFAKVTSENAELVRHCRHLEAYSFQFVMGILITKSEKFGIPLNVAMALVQIESSFNPQAISVGGDYGLFQINEKAWTFDRGKIFEPEYNIEFGLKILKQCYDRAGSWPLALALYNAGKNHKKSNHPKKLSESKFMKEEQ